MDYWVYCIIFLDCLACLLNDTGMDWEGCSDPVATSLHCRPEPALWRVCQLAPVLLGPGHLGPLKGPGRNWGHTMRERKGQGSVAGFLGLAGGTGGLPAAASTILAKSGSPCSCSPQLEPQLVGDIKWDCVGSRGRKEGPAHCSGCPQLVGEC